MLLEGSHPDALAYKHPERPKDRDTQVNTHTQKGRDTDAADFGRDTPHAHRHTHTQGHSYKVKDETQVDTWMTPSHRDTVGRNKGRHTHNQGCGHGGHPEIHCPHPNREGKD